MKNFSTRDMVVVALLIAIGILIPMIFVGPPFRIVVGPYSATLMAHVPVIIAMFISPLAALLTAVGTTIGFFFTAPLVVAVRAASHIAFALVGSYIITHTKANLVVVCVVTALIHAVLEGIVVMIFFATGLSTPQAGYSTEILALITVAGTFLHHIADYIIACLVYRGLMRAKAVPALPQFGKKS